MLQPNPLESLHLEITGLTDQGDGIGRLPEGWAVFVPDTAPGELVHVELLERHKRFARARLLSVERPSPQRITPACESAIDCGGCSWQHLGYEAQLEAKKRQVENALTRIGKFHGVRVSPVLSTEPWAYRNKVGFPVGESDHGLQLGYYRKGSHDLVPLQSCPAQDPRLNTAMALVQEALQPLNWSAWDPETGQGTLRHVILRVGRRTGELLLTLVTRHEVFGAIREQAPQWLETIPGLKGVCLNINAHTDQRILGNRTEVLAGQGWIEEEFGELLFRMGPETFFQIHTEQAEAMLGVLTEHLKFRPHDFLLDLYCGIGTFTLPLAKQVRTVLGLELAAASVEQARGNAARNNVTNVEFRTGPVEKTLRRVQERPDVVFLDPPRQGCASGVMTQLQRLRPKKIAYLSCNPATQARDLQLLGERYRIKLVQPADFFPHTPHVECLILLERTP